MATRRLATASCPDDDALGAFVEGRLERGSLRRIGEHLRSCDACCELVERYASAWQLELSGGVATAPPIADADGGPLAPGQSFARFVLLHRVGRGGMAEVYAAYDPVLDRRVALKLLHDTEGGRERALREARTLAALSHPNIVEIYDVGRAHGRDYIAMEFVEGTLAQWLARGGHDEVAILDAFRQAGLGLAAAHACGVVHRDFKPANVLVGRDHGGLQRIRVADFGLALPAGGVGGRAGTRGYIAPEQAQGAAPDPLADQYSFCVALREAFGGGAAQHTEREPSGPAPRVEGPRAASKRIAAAIARGMDPDPLRRFASMSALLEALRGPPRRRRVAMIAVGLCATIGLGLAVPTRARPCASVDALRDDLLDPSAVEAARRAFAATGLPFAELAWQRARETLETRVGAWARGTHDRCIAESDDIDDACHTRQRIELEQTLVLFGRADALTVTHASDVLDALGLDGCEGVAPGESPPQGPQRRADPSLVSALAAAQALRLGGHASAARAEFERIIDAAHDAGEPALRREAQLALGPMLPGFGESDAAATMLAEVAYAALADGDDTAALQAMTRLVIVESMRSRDDPAAARWERDAGAVLSRLGAPAQAGASLAQARGARCLAAGDPDGAIAAFREVLAQTEASHGAQHRRTADAARNLGLALFRGGQLDEARDEVARSLAIRERELGDHPDVAGSLDLLAAIEYALGEAELGRGHARRALAIYEGTHGPDHLDTINARLHLGVALESVEPEAARDLIAAAVASLIRVAGSEHHQTARARLDLAHVESRLGHDEAAFAAARAASDGLRVALGDTDVEAVAAAVAAGKALLRMGQLDDARVWLVDALARSEHAPPERRAVAIDALAGLEREVGNFSRAAELSDAGAAAWAEAYGAAHAEAVASRAEAAQARAALAGSRSDP